MPAATASLLQQLLAARADPKSKAERGKAYDEHLKALVSSLEKTPSSSLAAPAEEGRSPLEVLDPNLDTLPFLYTVVASIRDASKKGSSATESLKPGGPLWKALIRCLTSLDPVEARYAGQHWRRLVEYIGQSMLLAPTTEQTEPCVAYMAQAITRMDPTASTLTTLHIELLTCCLESQTYAQALGLLSHPIHRFPSKSTDKDSPPACAEYEMSDGFITEDSEITGHIGFAEVQKYYLLGAMVYIGVRDWTSAQTFLEHVICVPSAGAANMLMVEAYRKWLLCGLMASGGSRSMPSAVNSQALKHVRDCSKAYDGIAEAFKLAESSKLIAEIHEAQQQLHDDANFGLAQNVLQQHQKLAVSRLEKIYAAVPVSMVAEKFSMSEADATTYLEGLVAEGALQAKIESSAPNSALVVRFTATERAVADAEAENRMRLSLLQKTAEIQALDAHVAELDRRLGLSKEYVEHSRKARKNRNSKDAADAMDAPDVTLGGPASSDEDEQLMADG